MSSVLKALQRLEKQRSFEENYIRSDLNTVDASTVIRRKAIRNQHSKRRRLIGLIVLVIGIGTLFALAKTVSWNPRPDDSGTSPRKTVATISELTTAPEAKKPAFDSGAHPQKSIAPTSHTASPTQSVKKKAATTGKERSAVLKPATPSRTMPKSDRMAHKVPKPEKPFPQKAKVMTHQRPDASKRKVALKPAKAVIPSKHIKQPKRENENLKAKSTPSEATKELGLKLQAITWLNNPQKRFTVINDSIIRLDEMVDGFRLTHIEKDQVTVEKGNQKWLLKFNRTDF